MGRADIPLKLLTYWLLTIFLLWAIVAIIMTALAETSQPFPAGVGNVSGTLAYINQNHFYHYASEGFFTFFMVFACWLAAYRQTRQLRALALFATTWGVFAWLIYSRWTFATLDSGWNCGSVLSGIGGVTAAQRWCGISIASGVLSCLLELGKVLLWLWAIARFWQMRNVEPFCELDKSEIEAEQMLKAQLQQPNLAPMPGQTTGMGMGMGMQPMQPMQGTPQTIGGVTTGGVTTDAAGTKMAAAVPGSTVGAQEIHVRSTPVGLVESDVSLALARKITSFDQQRLSIPSRVVLFFCTLTTIGFIITMLSFIELYRWSIQDDAAQPLGPGRTGGFADQIMAFNIIFLTITLLFSVSFGAMSAYDRLRDNTVSPLFLNIITTLQLLGLVVHVLRRADIRPLDGSAAVGWSAQQAAAAGFAIMTFSELMRIGAMIWLTLTRSPAVHPHKPFISNHLGSLLYKITQSMMMLTALAWLIVMIIQCAQPGLYSSVNPTYATGLASPQESLHWAYHNFVIALMLVALFFASNYYINIAGTRTAVMGGYVAQLFVLGIWWLTCFNAAYNSLGSFGFLYSTFCGTGFSAALCRLTRANGILGFIMFGTFVLNTIISLWRLILVDMASKSALPTAELQRQGTTITRREAMARGTVGFGDTWLSAEGLLWLALGGWLIYAFGSTGFNRVAYYTITDGGARDVLGFEIFQLVAVHFLSIAGLFTVFIQSQIVTNKTYRDHSHAFRYAQFASFIWMFSYATPMLILMSRYTFHFGMNSSHLAALAGLAIFTGGALIQCIQYAVYSFMYPAQPVTVMMPQQQLIYDKAGNPIMSALPLDVEKGQTLNPHHDQAGLGTNYTKTDYRHQDATGILASAGIGGISTHRDKDSLTRDQHTRHENPTDIHPSGLAAERDTNIHGANRDLGTTDNTAGNTMGTHQAVV